MFTIPIEPVLVFLLVLMRMLFFFAFMPLFGEQFLAVRIRTLAAAAVALVFTPLTAFGEPMLPQTVWQLAGLMLSEAMLGAAFGFTGRLLFMAIQFAGGLMGDQIGFNMAQQVDPTQGGQMMNLSQALYVTSILIFFVTGAHHMFFAAMGASFENLPPGFARVSTDIPEYLSQLFASMISFGVQLSLPIIAVIFVTNAGMAMVSKGVPQVHVFLESFPIRIIVGLSMLGIILRFLVEDMQGLFATLEGRLVALLRVMGG